MTEEKNMLFTFVRTRSKCEITNHNINHTGEHAHDKPEYILFIKMKYMVTLIFKQKRNYIADVRGTNISCSHSDRNL